MPVYNKPVTPHPFQPTWESVFDGVFSTPVTPLGPLLVALLREQPLKWKCALGVNWQGFFFFFKKITKVHIPIFFW